MQTGIYSKKTGTNDDWELAVVARNRVLGNIIASFLASEVGYKFEFDVREMEV